MLKDDGYRRHQPVDRHHAERLGSSRRPPDAGAARGCKAPGLSLGSRGAGTGKTSTLTASVVHKIKVEELPASRLLVVTFTNKAAYEMTDRIRAALGDGAAPHWLGTFHGLGARHLRAAPEVAGIRPDFDILDADDSRQMIKRIMKALNLASDDDAGSRSRPDLQDGCGLKVEQPVEEHRPGEPRRPRLPRVGPGHRKRIVIEGFADDAE